MTLLESEIPAHAHGLMASTEDRVQGSLTAGITIANSVGGTLYQTTTNANLVAMNSPALPPCGG